MFIYEKNTDYFPLIQSSFASSFVLNRDMYEKADPEKLVKFVSQYGYLSNKLKTIDYQHFLLDEYDVQKFQTEFREFIGRIYGDHAKKMLVERPNITPLNIDNFIALDKTLYDNFGQNFVQQLLNYNYDILFYGTKNELNATKILERIIENKNSLKGFKYCINFVSENTPHSLYNYSKAFLTYSRFADLFDEICNLKLTKEQILDIKDAIISKPTHIKMSSLSELDEFKENIKAYYDSQLLRAENSEQIKDAVFGRFFGLEYMHKQTKYSKTNRNINELLKFYNVDKLIKYHKIQKQLGYKEIDITETEINILRLLSAINKIGGVGTAEVLTKLYTVLEKAENIIRPSDIEKLVEKIPQIYEADLKRTLSGIEDFENAYKTRTAGIEKIEIPAISASGKAYRIPVYQLKGIRFSALVTAVETNLSLPGLVGDAVELGKNWMEYENGTSHISASYITHDVPAAIEFTSPSMFGHKADKINYLLGKNLNIISMGNTDIFSNYQPRHPASTTLEATNFLFSHDLAYRSKMFDGFNEVTVDRYSLDEDRFGAKIIPEAIFKKGDMPPSRVINVAVEFTEYLREKGLVDKDFVMPIVMYDPDFYSERRSDISYRRQFSDSLLITENDLNSEKELISTFTQSVEKLIGEEEIEDNNISNDSGCETDDDNPDAGV